jgi:hypothetical protein
MEYVKRGTPVIQGYYTDFWVESYCSTGICMLLTFLESELDAKMYGSGLSPTTRTRKSTTDLLSIVQGLELMEPGPTAPVVEASCIMGMKYLLPGKGCTAAVLRETADEG